MVNGTFRNQNPEVVKELMKIYTKANNWAIDHPHEATDIVYSEFKLPKEIIYQCILKSYKNLTFTDTAKQANRQTLDYLVENKIIRKKIERNWENFYDH